MDEAAAGTSQYGRDVVQAGDLVQAVESLARQLQVDLGTVSASRFSKRNDSAHIDSHRGDIGVGIRADRGSFSMAISYGGHLLAAGDTDDLAQVVIASGAWRDGVPLASLQERFPFVRATDLGLAIDTGNQISFRWNQLLTDDELGAVRPFLRAAREDPRLGVLFPSVTHLTLVRMELDFADRTAGAVFVAQRRNGVFTVGATWSEDVHEAETVHDAVRSADSLLDTKELYDDYDASVALRPPSSRMRTGR
jgi:hypothetical protein